MASPKDLSTTSIPGFVRALSAAAKLGAKDEAYVGKSQPRRTGLELTCELGIDFYHDEHITHLENAYNAGRTHVRLLLNR